MKINSTPKYSNCCYALPIGELENSRFGSFGRCSECKENACFFTEDEFNKLDELKIPKHDI